MKKNILFVMNHLVCGGAEKSLISLLETMDYSKYHVDLFLFRHEGMFMNKLPKEVTLLPEPDNYKYFDMPIKTASKELLKKGEIKTAFNRGVLGYLAKTENNGAVMEQKFWRYLSKSIDRVEKNYDVAIGFQEKNPIYFCVDHVKADVKIGWIHTDYKKLGINPEREQRYFTKLDYVATVSEELVSSLKEQFPEYKDKFKCIYNIVSSSVIDKMSLEKVELKEADDNSTSLISVGRLAKEKGLDITLEAFDILVKKGYDIKWYLIGEGNVKADLERGIKMRQLEERIVFLGMKENPYSYIRKADIFIQASRYEGKSISINEAKILAKPILITNFETAKSHIKNNFNGIIADMDAVSVANNLERLIRNRDLTEKFIINLKTEEFGTENEIEKLYELMEHKKDYQEN
ncbi:glycosyltransferase [Peribacillus loiseleuriae]|uniref:Glycosyl transferase family 1 n=1 Tax=Peribacillus loiseleuriae TaxID=1679170 RepID=A0A0K9GZ35_9BACI|nr:glycosyltransferase [Peribacillus loiseleuriae]KMY51886.1 glycosyl transferase family 1 [Peribacillus loiseleuriae]